MVEFCTAALNRPVDPNRPRKSVGAEDTFSADIFDFEAARAEITLLVAKVWRHCEGKNLRGRTVTLKVKYADFQTITRSKTLATAFEASADIEAAARRLMEPLFPTGKGIRLTGVTLTSLSEHLVTVEEQLGLFSAGR